MNYYGAQQLADSWRTVRKNTIQIAEDIPADQYGFRATPESMSVGEMLSHMATSPHWAMQVHFLEHKSSVGMDDFGRYFGEARALAATLTDKATIVDALIAHGEALALQLEGISEAALGEMITLPNAQKSRFEMLLGLKEHEMHHRAQLMSVERMLGIVPHLTRARQQRS